MYPLVPSAGSILLTLLFQELWVFSYHVSSHLHNFSLPIKGACFSQSFQIKTCQCKINLNVIWPTIEFLVSSRKPLIDLVFSLSVCVSTWLNICVWVMYSQCVCVCVCVAVLTSVSRTCLTQWFYLAVETCPSCQFPILLPRHVPRRVLLCNLNYALSTA